jgi:UDP-glucose 4-epimerase
MDSVLVVGAAGFIGRRVCHELAHRGETVLGLGHGGWKESEWRQSGLSGWVADDITIDSLERVVRDTTPRAVVHCGGSGTVGYTYKAPLDDYQRTVVSTAAVLEFVRTRIPSGCRVVITSSAAVYGDQGDVDLVETTTRSPISPYGFNKVAAENLCDLYSRFFDVPTSIVRLFSVYGEGLRKQLLWDAMTKYASGTNRFLGTGNEMRDWVHVDDAASLLSLAATLPQESFEIYNGGHVKAPTRAVVTTLAAVAGYEALPVFSGETHSGNPRRLTANSQHAQRRLTWVPRVSLDDGLTRYAQWFLQLSAP